jgi:hypothetical protein
MDHSHFLLSVGLPHCTLTAASKSLAYLSVIIINVSYIVILFNIIILLVIVIVTQYLCDFMFC